MTSEIPEYRIRANVSQTAKGLHQIDVTVERNTDQTPDPEAIAEHVLKTIKAVEKKLKDDKRRLVTEEAL